MGPQGEGGGWHRWRYRVGGVGVQGGTGCGNHKEGGVGQHGGRVRHSAGTVAGAECGGEREGFGLNG